MIEKKRIFIIDDDSDVKELYELAFKDSEFELTYLLSSLDAIRILDKTPNPADVILIDLAMSGMDGLTLSERIRINEIKNRNRPSRMAFFTSYDTAVIPTYGEDGHFGFGVERVIEKPITPDKLLELLREWLPKTPENKSTDVKIYQPQNGATLPTLVTGIAGVVALIIVIAVYNRVLHSAEEAAAYRYTEKREQGIQYKNACDENWEQHAALEKWIEQQEYKQKPPPERLVRVPCEAVKKE